MVSDNVLLIGDSAGLAYPQSGECIRPAVESAMLAAGVIRSCGNDYSENNLRSYNTMMEHRFGKRLPEPELLQRLPKFVKRALARQLLKTRWFTRNVVIDKWFLQSHRTRLPAIKE